MPVYPQVPSLTLSIDKGASFVFWNSFPFQVERLNLRLGQILLCRGQSSWLLQIPQPEKLVATDLEALATRFSPSLGSWLLKPRQLVSQALAAGFSSFGGWFLKPRQLVSQPWAAGFSRFNHCLGHMQPLFKQNQPS